MVGAFLRKVDEALGKRTFVYASPGWYQSMLGSADFSGHPLWIAEYGVDAPRLCGAWTEYTIWQNSDHGNVAGIGTGVDMDLWNPGAAIQP